MYILSISCHICVRAFKLICSIYIQYYIIFNCQVETPQNTYNDVENQITKYYFETYNFTLMHLWTRYFVRAEDRKVNGSNTGMDVYLDEMDPNWVNHVHEANYVVVSGANWFFRQLHLYQQNKLIGTVYEQSEKKNIPALGSIFALQNAYRAALKFLYNLNNLRLVVVRTFTQNHFEGGAWNSDGYCNRTRPNLDLGPLSGFQLEMRNILLEEMEMARNGGEGVSFTAMDVTWMMDMRPDGHGGDHWDTKWNPGRRDCLHWCLPGPIDSWNQLLYLTLQKYI